ncbi:hypothetical protein SMSK597_1487 [Streptococcus mitis SK597]|uniref:Uncharacterized protein n=1 Tax=Streptococcus mitis SK597 TaxID=585204 RepID=E1LU42_STRMT|nr:hypothetical protein SMSK597_1487 [Streptococcus mitis SK597]
MSKMNKSLVIGSITWYHLSLTRGAPEINVLSVIIYHR